MHDEVTQFYLDREEPLKSALLALRDIILGMDPSIQAGWKYKSPFFMYMGKNLCYLWFDKRNMHPYIGLIDGGKIEHPLLVKGNRKQLKVLPVDPNEDFPIAAIKEILAEAMVHCEQRAKP